DTQALDDALAADGGSLEAGGPVDVEILFEDGDGQDIRKVALIPLHDEGEVAGVLAHAAELFVQLMEALQIFLEFACLSVRHKDDAVSAFKHRDASLLVEHLARDGIELKADLEAMDAAQVKRKQVEV